VECFYLALLDAAGMSRRANSLLITITAWNLVCLAMICFYAYFLRDLVAATYSASFGNIEESYERFSRIAATLGYSVVTLPASLISLRLLDSLFRRAPRWKQLTVTLLAWEVSVVFILVVSHEICLSCVFRDVGYAVYGQSEDVYGFQNLVLPRFIVWLGCTTPVAWIVLWRYLKTGEGNG
jgi:hypothetical protein